MEQPRVFQQCGDTEDAEYRNWARFCIVVDRGAQRVDGSIELEATPEEWDQYGHELNIAALEVGLTGEVDWKSWDEDGLQVDMVVAAGA